MKKVLFIFLSFFFLASCQKESLSIEQEAAASSFLQDLVLTELIKGVAAHDGSFDDMIDGASCYSINFPYQITLNGTLKTISSIVDLSQIDPMDSINIIYPITISRATYEEEVITTANEFSTNKDNCASGSLFNNRITCVDFVYPLEIGVYNEISNNFETIVLEHDKATFITIESFLESTLASIKFPVNVIASDNNKIEITSNDSLKNSIQGIQNSCL